MEIIHWDDCPYGTGFAVSQFGDGPFRGLWGILASLPDGGLVWVAFLSPPELVFTPSRVETQRILTWLRSYSKTKKVLEETGNLGDENPSGLPDPRTIPMIHWAQLPGSFLIQERQFRGGIWGIVALLPTGEYLVGFDHFAQNAGYYTFSATQAAAQRAIDWLKLIEPASDPQVVSRLRDVTATLPEFSPFGPDGPTSSAEPEGTDLYLLAALDRKVESDRQRITELEEEWRRRLAVGSRQSCLCEQCRHDIRRVVIEIMSWYGEPSSESDADVQEIILDAYRLLDLLAKK